VHLDLLTIFPRYFDVLEVSLLGRARAAGLLTWDVHDVRDHAHDRHRSVDDTPYGGGAGMVMRPEPWGESLAAVAGLTPTTLVVPSPAGRRFTQELAARWAEEPRLVFACGRYEGIDERVLQHAGRPGSPWHVEVVSLGDYVLSGGEVAALAIIEAVARLLPGVLGNEASLDEESHTEGLLEYPVFTKPASWEGLDVPEVLLSGNHAAVARWRRDESLRRTAQRRPDLLAAYPAQRCDAADLALLAGLGWHPAGDGFARDS
jgi:tRNA (guanine37-N1)-methyltransferase